MASPQLGGLRPSVRPERRAQAPPSLDVMAAQSPSPSPSSSALPPPPPSPPPPTLNEEATGASATSTGTGATAVQESRSSSSTNSPLPNDNEESDFFLVANDSQSSLGVPNIQDMQVNDDIDADEDDVEHCIPPANRLPNEILISIFARLSSPLDLFHCMLTSKRWSRNAVDLLWHRPACSNWDRHEAICKTLGKEKPYFSYKDFVKRLNLSSIADQVNDGSVMPLAVCNRIERITLTNCKSLTDTGLISLVQGSSHLLALDISGDDQITEATIFAIADNCHRLQGLNVTGCTKISNEGMIKLAENCKYMKRIKLNDCSQLTDEAVAAFADNCPHILEIDLHKCKLITNEPITSLLAKGQALRELRLTSCELIDDAAFLSLPDERIYEHLRILDLTSCVRLTDRAVERIIDVAPRLRNLVLAKCVNITDAAVYSIARLGKNLHYVHLGHCGHITDDAVKKLVQSCNRIRYIDLGCCVHLTDDSVTRLATLPKLKRIGLVKCSSITDESVHALAKANQRHRQRRDADGNVIENQYYNHSSLERVHLSYCTNLSIRSIIRLLDSCPRLTHLSLTGVPAFLREDLNQFCRSAPPEFTMHQREVFCVFSGDGVSGLRHHLNTQPGYAAYRERPTTIVTTNRRPIPTDPMDLVASHILPEPNFHGANLNDHPPFVPNHQLGHPIANQLANLQMPVVDPHLITSGNQVTLNGAHPLPPPISIPYQPAPLPSNLVPTAAPFTPAAFLHTAVFAQGQQPLFQQHHIPSTAVSHDGEAEGSDQGAQTVPHSMASMAPLGMPFSEGDHRAGPSTASATRPGPYTGISGPTVAGPSTASATWQSQAAIFSQPGPSNRSVSNASRAPLVAGNHGTASHATQGAPRETSVVVVEQAGGEDGNDGDAASSVSSSPSAA